jgi:ribosomal protein S18 acetylase RimI-like enzyme
VSRSAIDLAHLEIRPIAAGDASMCMVFSCGDADLDEFLRDDALRLDAARAARTWLTFYDGELVGYITLLCDAIILETRERKGLALRHEDHPVIPALKVARLGVSETFRAAHRGVGEALMQFAFATALSLSTRVGCRLLTLDAYAQSVSFYERLGFVRNRAKEYRDRQNPSMRFDLYAATLPPWATG